MRLQAEVPAKINRELRVGTLRPDGYHEIFSRIVSIDLCDRLAVESGAGDLVLSCEGPVPAGETNLVARAARALARRLGRPADARIHLTKRIPVGAGLGGGSADAAVALGLLARLWDARLELSELAALGAELGSDVPFFLTGGEADVSGRGERVEAREGAEVELWLLLPAFSISTSRVYETHRRFPARSLPATLEVEISDKYFGPNDLAFAVLETEGRMQAFVDSARTASAECTISGSGSAIALFGVTPEARRELAQRHPDAGLIRCRTILRDEYLKKTGLSGGL